MSPHDEPPPSDANTLADRSWLAVLFGLVPFLLWGGFLIVNEIPVEWIPEPSREMLFGVTFWLMISVPPMGLVLAWVQGFPRWSYPYAGLAGFFSLYVMNASTPGLQLFGLETFGREVWGLRACVPGLLALLIGLLITRSWQPTRSFFSHLGADLTLLSFAMFGSLPLLTFISFDAVDRGYTLPFMIGLSAIMAITAVAYLSSRWPWQRVMALAAGTLLVNAVNAAAPAVFFAHGNPVDLVSPAIPAIIWVGILLAPAVADLRRRASRSLVTP